MDGVAMIVILQDAQGRNTGAISVKPGERVSAGKYDSDEHPHVIVSRVNATTSGCTAYTFSGKAFLCSPKGEVIAEIFAEHYTDKGEK